MPNIKERLTRYEGLMLIVMRQVNELYYNSIADVDWKKAVGDYHRLETTLVGLGIVLEDIVTMFKIMNKGRK